MSAKAKHWIVGPTKYGAHGHLVFSFYAVGAQPDERIAIVLMDDDGTPILTCTVNFDDLPQQGCVWIKDWSENVGILHALIKANVGTPTGRKHEAGYVHAHELRLSNDVYVAARAKIKRLLAPVKSM